MRRNIATSSVSTGIFLWLLSGLLLLRPSILNAQAVTQTGWDLAWSDEFNYSGKVDAAKWQYEVGPSNVNNEKEYYSDNLANVRVDSGFLFITSLKQSMGGRNYTSGRINTENKVWWTYGRMEIRAKLPGGKGTWPAYWMLGHNCGSHGGWPACGEIDIMEYSGSNPNYVNSNLHMRDLNYMKGNNPHGGATLADPAHTFHTYALEWFPDHMDTYFDDKKILTFKNSNLGSGSWPYDNPQYIIINNAIGGDLGGQIDDSIFPTRWEIDYVRVYKPGTGSIISALAPRHMARRLAPDLSGLEKLTARDFNGRLHLASDRSDLPLALRATGMSDRILMGNR